MPLISQVKPDSSIICDQSSRTFEFLSYSFVRPTSEFQQVQHVIRLRVEIRMKKLDGSALIWVCDVTELSKHEQKDVIDPKLGNSRTKC